MDTTSQVTHISLCAGYGGIDLGLKRAIPNLRTIAFSEIEAFACANLVSKMEAGLLDAAPIWTDLKTFPWEQFCGKVDILSGGFPCQPFSCAGKRDGDEDPRHLFPYILDGIGRCKPSVVFLENVEGILSAKLAGDNLRDPAGTPVLLHVLRELERVGYKATAGVFSAAEVGAPHQRKRVFIMAHLKCEGLEGWRQRMQPEGVGCRICKHISEGGNLLADTLCNGSRESGEIQQGANGAEFVGISKSRGAWPSRPEQPQYEWEPPRVVRSVNTKLADFCTRDTQQRGDSSQTGREGSSDGPEGKNPMPDGRSSVRGRDQGNQSAPKVVANYPKTWGGGQLG